MFPRPVLVTNLLTMTPFSLLLLTQDNPERLMLGLVLIARQSIILPEAMLISADVAEGVSASERRRHARDDDRKTQAVKQHIAVHDQLTRLASHRLFSESTQRALFGRGKGPAPRRSCHRRPD